MSRKQPIFYFLRYVPVYRVAILEELDRRLDHRLVICTGRAGGADLATIEAPPAAYETQVLPDLWLGGERLHAQAFWQAFRKRGRPAAVLAEESPRSVTLPLLMAYCRARSIPVGLWGHYSSNARPMGAATVQDRYRMRLADSADVCICYTERQAELLASNISHSRIVAARNTLDTNVLFHLHDQMKIEGKKAVRARLGLDPDKTTLVYIGRLIQEKKVDLLLEVLLEVQKSRPAQLIIIGDGERRPVLEERIRRERIQDVHLFGAITGYEASAPYIFASDVMLVPGYLGLQVNHAFSFGVPIVSRRSPGAHRYHSPEVDFVEDGVNGILVDCPNARGFAEAVVEVTTSSSFSERAEAYSRNNLRAQYMVDGLERGIRSMLREA